MSELEEQRFEAIASIKDELEYEYAREEAFFMPKKIVPLRIRNCKEKICWVQQELETTHSRLARERLQVKLKMLKELPDHFEACAKRKRKGSFLIERSEAYEALQIAHVSHEAINRAINALRGGVKSLLFLRQITQQRLRSQEGERDAEKWMAHVRDQLEGCTPSLAPRDIALKAENHVRIKFDENGYID